MIVTSKQVGDRVRAIRQQSGLTQIDFGKVLDVKQAKLSTIEKGEVSVDAVLLKSLYDKMKISPLWVCTGIGSMKAAEPDRIPPLASVAHDLEVEKAITKMLVIQVGDLNKRLAALEETFLLFKVLTKT